MSTENASQNVTAFIAKYGEKGFLTIYFSNYLYELILSYLRAHSDTASKDSGYAFHFAKAGQLRTTQEDEEFRRALRVECDKKSSQIVAALDKRKLVEKFSEDLDVITAEMTEEVDSALKEIFEGVLKAEWGTQG